MMGALPASQGHGFGKGALTLVASVGLYMRIFWCPLEVIRSASMSNATPGEEQTLKPFQQPLSVIHWGLDSPYSRGG